MIALFKESHEGAKVTLPTRSLMEGKRYTHSSQTDIRKTIEAHKRLIRMKQSASASQGISA